MERLRSSAGIMAQRRNLRVQRDPLRENAAKVHAGGANEIQTRAAGLAAAILGCGLVLFLFHGLSRGIDYKAMLAAVLAMPRTLIFASILLTALSYFALIARDHVALTYAEVKIPSSAMILASFCASALGNAFGFGVLTGRSVRDRVYSSVGVLPEQTAKVTLLVGISFSAGVFTFAACGVTTSGHSLSLLTHSSTRFLHVAGALMLVAIAGTVVLARRQRRVSLMIGRLSIERLSPGFLFLQLLLVSIDLLGAAAALWVLFQGQTLDFPSFAVVFSVAVVVGAISRIPGGLVVFEAIFIFALGRLLSPERIAAALLVYRGIYFLAPLLIATTSLAGLELRRPTAFPANDASGRLFLAASLLAPVFLSVVTFSVGLMLIISGATPAVDWRLTVLQQMLPLWAVEISHLLATLAGVFLLFVARGLYHRLDGAWWLAFVVAIAAGAFSLAKGLAFAEIAATLFLVLLLLATRRQFTRPAAFLRQSFTLGWFIAIAAVIAAATGILLFAFRDVAYRHEIWWQFEFDAQASRALRAILGASIFTLAVSLRQLLRTSAGRVAPPSPEELSRAAFIIRTQERSAAVLGLMGDKSFLFSSSGKSFLMYSKWGQSWIALFDPVGPCHEWPELVWRFVELAGTQGGRAAFYQIRPESLPLYLDAGLRIVKVGEEARIDLKHFGLDGSHRYGLRQALKRAERESITFEIITSSHMDRHEQALKGVSEEWLSSHRTGERRFSVAAFEPRFVGAQSALLARHHGKPLAFVTFMTTDLQSEATIGLMRQVSDAPPYTMECLLTRIALELKEMGFERLSLGMAPLAGLARTPLASRWHMLAGLLWEYGRPIYNFQGLRAFKNKFRPVWEPRYLAASGVVGPFVSMADIAALVSGYPR
jgi:phosphatidylglycerol lysyltransferase